MAVQIVNILPKTQLSAAFTQGPGDTVDAAPYATVALQVWLSETLTTGEQVVVYLDHSLTRRPADFSELTRVTYDGSNVIGPTTGMQLKLQQGGMARYLRLRVTPTSYTGTMTVRAVALLRDTD